MRPEFRGYTGQVILNASCWRRWYGTSEQLCLLVENCALLCDTMGADGWAGYPEDKAVGKKNKPGENMIASKIEGTGPTEPTTAVEFPIQVQRLWSDPCLFLLGADYE